MQRLTTKEIKRRIRTGEPMPDSALVDHPELFKGLVDKIVKVKDNPKKKAYRGSEARPRLHRTAPGKYARSKRSKLEYPEARITNPQKSTLAAGYILGYYDAKDGAYRGDSTDAWEEYTKLHAGNPSLARKPKSNPRSHHYRKNAEGDLVLEDFEIKENPKESYFVQYDDGRQTTRVYGFGTYQEARKYADSLLRQSSKIHIIGIGRGKQPVRNPHFSAAQRRKYAASGAALPDGSFPIRNREDLMDALHDLGRTNHYAEAKRHIIRRAKVLGLTSSLNKKWVERKGKKRNPDGDWQEHFLDSTPETDRRVKYMKGMRLSFTHPSSSYSIPVLVDAEGNAFGYNDVVPLLGKPANEVVDQLYSWGRLTKRSYDKWDNQRQRLPMGTYKPQKDSKRNPRHGNIAAMKRGLSRHLDETYSQFKARMLRNHPDATDKKIRQWYNLRNAGAKALGLK